MTSNLKENEMKKYLRPEFINRIDDIIHFNDLGIDTIKTIVNNQINIMKNRIKNQGIKIDIHENVEKYLLKNGYDLHYGARPIGRIIRSKILAGLSRYLLKHPSTKQIRVFMDGNLVTFNSSDQCKQAA